MRPPQTSDRYSRESLPPSRLRRPIPAAANFAGFAMRVVMPAGLFVGGFAGAREVTEPAARVLLVERGTHAERPRIFQDANGIIRTFIATIVARHVGRRR